MEGSTSERLAKGLTLIDTKAAYLLGETLEHQKWLLFELARHFGKLLEKHFETEVTAKIYIPEIPGIKGG